MRFSISLCGNAIFSLFIRSISPFITRKYVRKRKNDKANHSSLETVKDD